MNGFSLSRAILYLCVTALGIAAGWLAAAGFGTYDEVNQTFSFTVDIKVFGAYIAALVGGGGTAFTALVKGWGGKTPAPPSP